MQPNSAIQRLWTGALWAEGPAWNGESASYLVFSDIPNNRQMRWLEDDGRVTVFRMPSNNSNGNTFDYQGRQISCEHLMRRVVRYELDGSVTVLADNFQGKRLNSPNDAVPHPDGSVWFTDPPYGGQLYEGAPDAAGGASNAAGLLNPTLGQPAGIGTWKRELPTQSYRLDPNGTLTVVATEAQAPDPNGLCFSPDHKKLYIASTGKGPGDTGPGGKGTVIVMDVADDGTTSNHRQFGDFVVDGVKCGPDGVRCDVAGNLWASSNAGRNVGYNGATVWSPGGQAAGPHPPARGRRQSLLRRPQAQSPVHRGQPVDLRRLHLHPRCRARLIGLDDLTTAPAWLRQRGRFFGLHAALLPATRYARTIACTRALLGGHHGKKRPRGRCR